MILDSKLEQIRRKMGARDDPQAAHKVVVLLVQYEPISSSFWDGALIIEEAGAIRRGRRFSLRSAAWRKNPFDLSIRDARHIHPDFGHDEFDRAFLSAV